MDMTRLAIALVVLTGVSSGCEKKATQSPNLIEQTADDVGGEIDNAGESTHEAADDVDETLTRP